MSADARTIEHPAWCHDCMRFGQVNLRETDPGAVNVAFWADFWRQCRLHGIVLNAGGIVAYYPTHIPLHRRSPWLGARDLFGELCRAAKAQGMRVLARIDPSRTHHALYDAHPDWFIVGRDGTPSKAGDLFQTCVNGPYFREFIPGVFREVHANYDVDGFFGNAWNGARELCYCPFCEEKYRRDLGGPLPDSRTPAWELWRSTCDEELWRFWDDCTKRLKPDTIWMGNHAVSRIADLAAMINADFQRRSVAMPMWQSGEMGKRMRALTDARKPYFHIHSANIASRHLARPEAEQRLWLAEAVAADSRPWFTYIGGTQWDRRQFAPVADFYAWHARHERYFRGRVSAARVGVVESPDRDAYAGMYEALLRDRIPFDLIHPSHITADRLAQYAATVLPNAERLSDDDCAALAEYVEAGGGLVATFQASLADETGRWREDFGLADVFGVRHARGDASEPMEHSYMRIERPDHPLVAGIRDTDRTLFDGAMVSVVSTADEPLVLTLVPPYPTYPPEKAFPHIEHTDTPMVFVRQHGRGRCVYFPHTLDRLYWQRNLPDHARLLANAVRWAANGDVPVQVEGRGLLDVHVYRQEGGNVQVHLVNLSNPDMRKAPVHELLPIGPLRVAVRVPPGAGIRRVHLLVGEDTPSYEVSDGCCAVTVPTVEDHEVVIVEL
jgi:type 1 glutamine amidotransferase